MAAAVALRAALARYIKVTVSTWAAVTGRCTRSPERCTRGRPTRPTCPTARRASAPSEGLLGNFFRISHRLALSSDSGGCYRFRFRAEILSRGNGDGKSKVVGLAVDRKWFCECRGISLRCYGSALVRILYEFLYDGFF